MNVNLNIVDTCCSKCFKNSTEKNINVTSRDTSIELQNEYFLNVLDAYANKTTILIQNGDCVIIRNILNGVQTDILIPSNCTHILSITAS